MTNPIRWSLGNASRLERFRADNAADLLAFQKLGDDTYGAWPVKALFCRHGKKRIDKLKARHQKLTTKLGDAADVEKEALEKRIKEVSDKLAELVHEDAPPS